VTDQYHLFSSERRTSSRQPPTRLSSQVVCGDSRRRQKISSAITMAPYFAGWKYFARKGFYAQKPLSERCGVVFSGGRFGFAKEL